MSVIRNMQGTGFIAGLITGGTSATAAVIHVFVTGPVTEQAANAPPLTATIYWLIAMSVLMLCNLRLVRKNLLAQSSARQANLAACSDALTLMPNRRAMVARMTQVQTAPDSGCCGVLVIDLDHFKSVNDELGHAAGDHVLQQVSLRIRRVCGPHRQPFRTGGDEFAIVVDNLHDPASLEQISRDLSLAIAVPICGDGWCVAMLCSIGHAFGEARLGVEQLMQAADGNMYQNKAIQHLQYGGPQVRRGAGNPADASGDRDCNDCVEVRPLAMQAIA